MTEKPNLQKPADHPGQQRRGRNPGEHGRQNRDRRPPPPRAPLARPLPQGSRPTAPTTEPKIMPAVLPPAPNRFTFSKTAPKLRVYALGGLEEIGRNCTVFECGDDIIIVDIGLMFPEEGMPGIDYVIPNVSSLVGKEKNIRGIIVTHGHMDHIGGLPLVIGRLGNPVIYTAPLTAGIIRKRSEEFGNAKNLRIQLITGESKIALGRWFVFEPFHVNHNISDAFGAALHTPFGTL